MVGKHKNIAYDQWLAQVLKRDVYQLFVDDDLTEKTEEQISREYELLMGLQSGHVFIYSRVSPEALAAVRFLESRGFNLIDTNITFDKLTTNHNYIGRNNVRFANLGDQYQVVELARRGTGCNRR